MSFLRKEFSKIYRGDILELVDVQLVVEIHSDCVGVENIFLNMVSFLSFRIFYVIVDYQTYIT